TRRHPHSTPFPYTTLFRSRANCVLNGTGNTGPMRDILMKSPEMEFAGSQTPVRSWMAMLDGNYAEAERVLVVSPREDFQDVDLRSEEHTSELQSRENLVCR